eukprot:CAMPEP_0175393940 /NCGR_PEP_ID=MMETSP0095-20121207/33186_1 /TAXON_ID=311494 /ORGANISM="Alexandrium monilatum, Strain CCMP3105" /LENGTH=247 /DNA_ID=CAMNT_0016692543 /DNA_START=1 /DNA_END=743 /DNA_ORIENTATION=-
MALGTGIVDASLKGRALGQLPLVEKMRIEAARRLAHDEELDAIERELRSDLQGRGGALLGHGAAVPGTAAAHAPCGAVAGAGRHSRGAAAAAAAAPGSAGRELLPPGDAPPPRPRDSVRREASSHWQPSLLVQTLPLAPGCTSRRGGWRVDSQEAWQLGKERCTLTTLLNDDCEMLRFELLKFSTADTVFVTCTREQFVQICGEQVGLTGADRVNAAVHQLFREALDSGVKPSFLEGGSFSPLVERV